MCRCGIIECLFLVPLRIGRISRARVVGVVCVPMLETNSVLRAVHYTVWPELGSGLVG